jgi:hypothetical protein
MPANEDLDYGGLDGIPARLSGLLMALENLRRNRSTDHAYVEPRSVACHPEQLCSHSTTAVVHTNVISDAARDTFRLYSED